MKNILALCPKRNNFFNRSECTARKVYFGSYTDTKGILLHETYLSS